MTTGIVLHHVSGYAFSDCLFLSTFSAKDIDVPAPTPAFFRCLALNRCNTTAKVPTNAFFLWRGMVNLVKAGESLQMDGRSASDEGSRRPVTARNL